MHVIITGGTGLIGRALVDNLISDGYMCTVLSRSPGEKNDLLPDAVSVVGWDAETAEGWGHLVNEADAIVNLAGENLGAGRWTTERKQRIRDSRMNAGKAVVTAIRQAANRPDVVVQASAVGYYGPSGDTMLDESAPPGSDFLAQICVEWESSTASVKELGVRQIVTRSGAVLSTQGGALPRMLPPFRLGVGGPVGGGNQYFSSVHLDDEVQAIRFLLELAEADGPYNIGWPDPPTNKEFSRTLGDVLSRPTVMPVPAVALKILYGEMATTILDGQRAIPERLQQRGFHFKFVDAEETLRDLLTRGK